MLINPEGFDCDKVTHQYPKSVNDRFVYMQRMMLIIMGACVVVGIVLLF